MAAFDGERPFAVLAFTVLGDRAVAIDVFNDSELVAKLDIRGSPPDRYAAAPAGTTTMPTAVIGHDPEAKRVSACRLGTDSLSIAPPVPFRERHSSTPEPATPPGYWPAQRPAV